MMFYKDWSGQRPLYKISKIIFILIWLSGERLMQSYQAKYDDGGIVSVSLNC